MCNTQCDMLQFMDVPFNREPKWNLNNYIKKLRHDLRSWRKIYWKLWGLSHHLYCKNCATYYPAYYAKCCEYHPNQPAFGPITRDMRVNEGHYPCCGQRIFRYDSLPTFSGCQCKGHVPQKIPNIPQTVYETFIKHESLIVGDPNEISGRKRPPKASFYGNSDKENDIFNLRSMPQEEVICWFGMNQFPSSNNCILGLPRVGNSMRKNELKEIPDDRKKPKAIEPPEGGSNKVRQSYGVEGDDDLSDETLEEDCEHDPLPQRVQQMFSTYFSPNRKRRKRYFIHSLKNYFKNHPNEPENAQDDFMREHEYQLMMTLISRLVKKNASKDVFSDIWPKYSNAVGGAYSQLEAEWRDENLKLLSTPSSGGSGSVSGASTTTSESFQKLTK